MEIKIRVDDITTFAKALNNATMSYFEIIHAISLCCDIPKVLEPLRKVDEAELNNRLTCLMDVYEQVEEIERSAKND